MGTGRSWWSHSPAMMPQSCCWTQGRPRWPRSYTPRPHGTRYTPSWGWSYTYYPNYMLYLTLQNYYCRTGYFRRHDIFTDFADFNKTANTILMIYLPSKYSKVSCPQNGIFGNPRKHHVRENVLSYSTQIDMRLH